MAVFFEAGLGGRGRRDARAGCHRRMGRPLSDRTESFYDFRIHGENRGYSYLLLGGERLFSLTRFRLEDGTVFTNVFRLTLDGDHVLACCHGERPCVDLRAHPPDHYPGCAYPLLLPKALTEPFAYVQVSEDDGTVGERAILEADGPVIEETVGGKVVRRFELSGATCVRINWGGAISTLRGSGEEAAAGSGIAFAL